MRILLVWDNLAGHLSHALFPWLFQHGTMPLYTPLGGSWLNMAESLQRIIVRRALAGQHPQSAQQVIDWLEPACRRVECGSHFLCLGRQTPCSSRACTTATTRRVGGRTREGLLNCGVTH